MEILEKISFNDCNISDLLLDLNLCTTNLSTISPSNFILEMQLTTEERLDKIKSSFCKKKKGTEELDILPNIIIFQNFREDSIYSVPLKVVNRSKYPCPVRFILSPSPYISMSGLDSIVPAKLAAGMDLQCIIQFKPEKNKDYFHKFTVLFSDTEYTVPIIAIGPRPLLTFPDNILLCESPVRVETEKFILVRNISAVPGIFKIQCRKPFEMIPASGILDPNSSMQFVIKFNSLEEGLYNDTILIRYDTGENLIIYVQAIAKSSNVNLSKSVIEFDDTFKGLKCQKSVKICNNSDHIVRFTWKSLSSDEEDKTEGDKIKESFDIVRDIESRKNCKLEHFDVVDKDTADVIYERICKDEIIEFDNTEQFMFSNKNFIIEPLTGEIWPNSSMEITVIFFPQTVKNISCTAFCQVSGKNERLSLELKGQSIGAKFRFNIMSIDLGVVYLFADQTVQMMVSNTGNIPGDISYFSVEKYTACKVICEPESLYIKPFEDGTFHLSVICNEEGSFVAEIVFIITDSNEKLKVLIRGHVIYAKLCIVEKECYFGQISLGSEEQKAVTLVNETTIQIPFHASVYPDGNTPAISYASVNSLKHKHMLPSNPQEYNCEPSYGLVPANSSCIVTITLLPNQARKFCTFFNVDSWSQVSHRIAIPLLHTCLLPDLVCTPSDVNIRFCFLHYLCQRLITIKNKSCVKGKIWIYTEENQGIKVDADVTQAIIEPYCSVEVSLNIICTELGKQHSSLKFCLFGGEESIACNVECIGQGPVIIVTPEHLNFGKIDCLLPVTKSICVFNDSPTRAEIFVQVKRSLPWVVSQNLIYLEPEESTNVDVTCYLNDMRKFKGKIIFDVSNRSAIEVLVTAVGIGTCIEVIPPITPFLNLGPQLTKTMYETTLVFTNRGTRLHKIFILTTPNKKPEAGAVEPRFSISPNVFCLKYNDSIEVTLQIRNNKEEEVQEDYFIHALIENMQKKKVIMESTFLVNFVEPSLFFSKKVLSFRVDIVENKIVKIDEDVVEIDNITPLTLEMDLQVSPPFYILDPNLNGEKVNKFYLKLTPTEKFFLEIYFDSATKEKLCYVFEKRLELYFRNHVRKEILNLSGEVNYPSIKFFPDNVTFYSNSFNTTQCHEIEIRNISPLPLNFQLEWRGESTTIRSPPTISLHPNKLRASLLPEVESIVSTELTPIEEEDGINNNSTVTQSVKKKGKAAKEGKAPKANKAKKKEKGNKKRSLPVELIFLHYYIETKLIYHNIELKERILGPISKESLIQLPEENITNLQKMKQNLFSPIDNFIEDLSNYDIIKCMRTTPVALSPIDEILHIIPSYGYLNPFESQILTLSYHPNCNLSFWTKVACYVSGGVTEFIKINGVTSNINYYIETTKIDFGKLLFNDICVKPLHLINTGIIPFTFNVLFSGFGSCYTSRLLELGWIEISPTTKMLAPQEEIYIIVKYTPGLAGRFMETFDIEIAELPLIHITVTGTGLLPQVYLNLTRRVPPDEYVLHCYKAITNLTTDFMDIEIVKKIAALNNEILTPDLPKEEKQLLRKDGWAVISQYKPIPSKIDIDLAIERLLAAVNIVYNHPSLLTFNTRKVMKFPKIYASSYTIDFGYVIVDEMEHRTIDIMNYGPGNCYISILCGSEKTQNGFIQAGFNIQPMEISLASGEIHPLYILFSPLSEVYKEKIKKIEYKIYLQVFHGLRIPIEVSATVTRPYLELSTRVLQFQKVFCGQCKIMNIAVINNGPIPCLFEAVIVPSRHQIAEKSIYFLHESRDTLEPNDCKSIDITFEPKENDIYNWKIFINVEKCEKKIVVNLKGEGVLPKLHIDNLNLTFTPCIPYEVGNSLCFSIENRNEYPIEYYLTSFDKQVHEEEKIIKLLCHYYANDKLYIPQRHAGDKLPQTLYNFYEEQFNEFRQSAAQSVLDSDEDINQNRPFSTKTKKKQRNYSGQPVQTFDPFSNKSTSVVSTLFEEFIRNKVAEHIIMNDDTNPRSDPIATALEMSKIPCPPDPEKINEGVLFIFYGAPYSDFLYAANRVGKHLHIPILNLDKIIIEALVYSSTISSLKINEIINEAYEKTNVKGVPMLDETNLSPLQIIEEKIIILKNKLTEKKSGTSKTKDKTSKTSAGKKSKKNDDNFGDTFLSIPQDHLIELMKNKFMEFKSGILIETLDNSFIRTPILSLLMLLQAVGNIRYIHGTLLYSNQDLYRRKIYNSRMEAIKEKENYLIETMLKFDSINYDALDELTAEEVNLYKTYYVAKRKEESVRRLEALRTRMLKKRPLKSILNMSTRLSIVSQKTRRTLKSSAKESVKTNKSAKSKNPNVVDISKIVLKPNEMEICMEMEKFETICDAIMHIFEYWNRKTCTVMKDYVPKGQTKSKKDVKSSEKRSKTIASGVGLTAPVPFEKFTGIPTFLINSYKENRTFLEYLPNILAACDNYQNATISLENSFKKKIPLINEQFSIVYKPIERPTLFDSKIFVITSSLNVLDDDAFPKSQDSPGEDESLKDDFDSTSRTSRISIMKTLKASSLPKKKKKKLKKSFVLEVQPILESRTLLQPGQKCFYKVNFCPKVIGNYNYNIGIEVVGCKTKYNLQCDGLCDFPRIDMSPNVLYPTTIRGRNIKNRYIKNVYIKKENFYDFGYMLVCKNPLTDDRMSIADAYINLKNISRVDCNIHLHLIEQTSSFRLYPEKTFVAPDNMEILVVNACPLTSGPNKNLLAVSIKNNPKIELISIQCTGCNFLFDISPKKVNFERILLHHGATEMITLNNRSHISVYWQFTNVQSFNQCFIIEPRNGIIRPLCNAEVVIEYLAHTVEIIAHKKLFIEITNECGPGKPLLTDSVELNAETCDLLVKCARQINFGVLKARKNHVHLYNFINQGKYNISFELIPHKHGSKKENTIASMFKADSLTGVLIPNKSVNLGICLNTFKTISVKNFNLFSCNLMDQITKEVLSTFDITVNVKTCYSLFNIYPNAEINFGAMLLGTRSSQKITITNTGHLDFNFNVMFKKTFDIMQAELLKAAAIQVDQKQNKKNKKNKETSKKSKTKSEASKKSSKLSSKEKSKKSSKTGSKQSKLVSSISSGVYTIKNTEGIIEPQSSTELEIQCTLKEVGDEEDYILIFISETCARDRNGKSIKLKATGCLPSLTWDDYNFMFNKHFIVKTLQDFVKSKEMQEHCVFVKQNNCLNFNNVIINTTFSGSIQLYNNSLLEADVNLQTTGSSTFKIKTPKINIQPLSKTSFEIDFTPVEITAYEGSLVIQIVMPTGIKTETKKYLLNGEGRVPEIVIIRPKKDDDYKNLYHLTFRPTLINKFTNKMISFQNTGDFPCKVILEIFEDSQHFFSFVPKENTIPLLNCPEIESTQHMNMVFMIPEEIAEFAVAFKPQSTGKYTCEIRVHIVNNPFEMFTILSSGECFSEDIFLENIPTNKLNSTIIENINDVTTQYCTSYVLDFGKIFVNVLQKSRFKIVNSSSEKTYKFVFRSAIKDTVFIPAIGHLKPNSFKDIFVTFVSETPVIHKTLLMDCLISQINYTGKIPKDIPWDERQKLIVWDYNEIKDQQSLNSEIYEMEGSSKMYDSCPEPEYDVIEDSIRRIPILFSAKVNYSFYETDLSNIKFRDTFLFEKSSFSFNVFNIGDVNLEINWSITLQHTKHFPTVDSSHLIDNVSLASPRKMDLLKNYKNVSLQLGGSENTNQMSGIEMPFKINCQSFCLMSKHKQEVTLTFQPLEVYDYKARLLGTVKNLAPNLKNINVEIIAKSRIPCCHFDVQFSDYITSGRRLNCMKNYSYEIDENTKCIEFDCLGVKIQHSTSFNIINPTDEELCFIWQQIASYEVSSVPLFSCQPTNDSIAPGKMIHVTFSVFPQSTGTFESAYVFKTTKYNTVMNFLIVANVRESNVIFLTSHISLKPTVIGAVVNDYIILRNAEDVSLEYKFKKNSLFSEGRKQFVVLEPNCGLLPKKSETKLKLSFKPSDIGVEEYLLKCCIHHLQEPLTITVTTKCYEVELLASYILPNGKKVILNADIDNVINLEDMLPKQETDIQFLIRNIGNVGFYYQWFFNKDIIERKFIFNLSSIEGYLKMNTELNNSLKITALKNAILKNYKLDLQVRFGPKFRILLNGIVTNTAYKFSFSKIDFGPCLIQRSSLCYNHKTLEFLNCGNSPLTLECNFLSNNYITIDFKIKKVLPKTKEQINICFHPKKAEKYTADIQFNINNQKVKLLVCGEGIELDIAVVNVEDKTVILGAPQIGNLVSKSVKVINKCPITVKAVFNMENRLQIIPVNNTHLKEPVKKRNILDEEINERKGKFNTSVTEKNVKLSTGKKSLKIVSDQKNIKTATNITQELMSTKSRKSKKIDISKQSTQITFGDAEEREQLLLKEAIRDTITILPTTPITMLPNKPVEFTINYLPALRIPSFSEKISVQVMEIIKPLCIVQGACVGPVFYLDRTEISFGVVVLHCFRSTKLLLHNEGDVSSRFEWESNFDKAFSITPMQGYSMPNTTTSFVVEYHPSEINIQSKNTVLLKFELYDKPLCVKLIGICSDIPESSGTIEFTCQVRMSEKKPISLTNTSNRIWKVYPCTDSENFTCPDLIIIKPKGVAMCEIFYKPLKMTKNTQHKGTVFFKLPDGQALLYKLSGTALAPEPVKIYHLDTPCKKEFTHTLLLKNWLGVKQKFEVYNEDISNNNEINYYELMNHEFVDIMGNQEKNYEWNFYGYKECYLEFRIIFMNQEKEYIHYQINLKVTKCIPLETFYLSTSVRNILKQTIILNNPTSDSITYKLSSAASSLSFTPIITVDSHREVEEHIKFRPLLCEKTKAFLEATCLELGTYLYEFQLTGLPTGHEPTIYFTTELGKSVTAIARIENLGRNKTAFATHIEIEDSFQFPKSITLNPNQSSNVTITYNPYTTKGISTLLSISSTTAGEYIFPLNGTCSAPKPRGPFIVKQKGETTINFKNPFLIDYSFEYIIESDIFILNLKEELIQAKTATKIIIKLTENFVSEKEVNAKLLVLPNPQFSENIKWTYYLKALPSLK